MVSSYEIIPEVDLAFPRGPLGVGMGGRGGEICLLQFLGSEGGRGNALTPGENSHCSGTIGGTWDAGGPAQVGKGYRQ